MDIGVVRMGVDNGFVPVLVGMGLPPIPGEGMCMLVMRIVPMAVRVDEQLMAVLVFVPFGEVQEDAGRHQRRAHPESCRSRFVKHGDRDRSADEGRSREISARASSTQPA